MATGALFAALVLAGMAWTNLRDTAGDSGLRRSRQFMDLTGLIVSAPVMQPVDEGGDGTWRFEFRAESIQRGRDRSAWSGRVSVYLRAGTNAPSPAYGDRWRLRGAVRADDPVKLRRLGVAGIMTVNEAGVTKLEAGRGHPFVAWCYAQRERAAGRLGAGLPSGDSSTGLTRALLLGLRDQVDPAVREAFVRTGTLHILALSGMHVGILVMLLVIVLKAAGVNRPYWIYFFLPFLASYTIATGASASTVRATIMATVYFSAYALRKKPDGPSSLALAALLILAGQPRQLVDPGFMLSFIAVGGLMLLVPPIRSMLMRRAPAEEFRSEPELSWWSPDARRIRERLADLLTVSLAAWLVSLPVIISMFNILSPSALLVNIPLVPLAFVILLTACLSVLSGFISPAVAAVFNHANSLFGGWLLDLVSISSAWPGSHVYVMSWPWYLVLLWFVLLIGVAAWRGRARWTVWILLVGLVFWSATRRYVSSRVDVVMMSAGDAAVALVDGPGNQAVLFDTGDAYHQRDLVTALRRRGINHLDAVWITRARTDAYGGLSGLVSAMPVRAVYVPEAPPGQKLFHASLASWQSALPAGVIRPWTGLSYMDRREVILRPLFPPPGSGYDNAVSSSLAVHISRGSRSVLFMGQCTEAIAGAAAQIPVDWAADVLAVGLVERAADIPAPWLALVAPGHGWFSPRAFDRAPDSLDSLVDRLRNDRTGVSWQLVEDDQALVWSL